MKRLSIWALLVLMSISCSTGYVFWDISRFNFVTDALENGEEIKILYTSRGPDNNEDLDYYIHLVVVSQKTGDTVNVLTTVENGFGEKDRNQVFNFINKEDMLMKIVQMETDNLSKENIEKTELKQINKVARDTTYDHVADNNYPSIIGLVGNIAKNEVKAN